MLFPTFSDVDISDHVHFGLADSTPRSFRLANGYLALQIFGQGLNLALAEVKMEMNLEPRV